MKKIAVVLGLVMTLKTVAEVREPFYRIDSKGEGVWWERLVATDGTFCRHLWEPDFDLTGRSVECAWTKVDEFPNQDPPAEDPNQGKVKK